MKALIVALALTATPARGGAIAWGTPLCLLVVWHPLILGNDCMHGFTPSLYKRETLI